MGLPKLLTAMSICGAAVAVAPQNARAESDCDSVLKTTLSKTSISTSAHDQAAFSFACSHDFEEFSNTYGASASASYAGIGGSGSYSQGNYKKFQHDKCSQASSSEHKTNFEYNALVDASADVVNNWRLCMANQNGFNCWAEPESGNISIVLNLKSPGTFHVRNAVLSDSTSYVGSSQLVADNADLPFGATRVAIARQNPATPVSLSVNIGDNIQALSCRVAIPGVLPIEPTPVVAKASLCANIDGDWYSNGNKGKWHIDQRECLFRIHDADIGGVHHWVVGTMTGDQGHYDVFRTDAAGCTVHFYGTVDHITGDSYQSHVYGTDGKCGFSPAWVEHLDVRRQGT